jgi:ubiquinone/menaquinone biosynthesis C-methylase UbiE
MKEKGISEIQKGWQDEDVAESYDEKRFRTWSGKLSDWLDKRAIRKALGEARLDAPVLDLPCGTGRILDFMYRSGFHYLTGADISDQMLNVAKRKMNGKAEVRFAITDATNTGFPDGSFKAITSIRFMGHLPRDTRLSVLREFGRICGENVIVEYPMRSTVAGFAKKLLHAFTVRARLGQGQWSWNTLSEPELDAEFRSAGLSVVRKIRKLPFLSDSVFVIARRSAEVAG